jgi:hypothetical protein
MFTAIYFTILAGMLTYGVLSDRAANRRLYDYSPPRVITDDDILPLRIVQYEFDVESLKALGYSDAEIDEVLVDPRKMEDE